MNLFVKMFSVVSFLAGGLDEQVNEVFLLNAFVPFGDIVQVQIPKDPTSGEHTHRHCLLLTL